MRPLYCFIVSCIFSKDVGRYKYFIFKRVFFTLYCHLYHSFFSMRSAHNRLFWRTMEGATSSSGLSYAELKMTIRELQNNIWDVKKIQSKISEERNNFLLWRTVNFQNKSTWKKLNLTCIRLNHLHSVVSDSSS